MAEIRGEKREEGRPDDGTTCRQGLAPRERNPSASRNLSTPVDNQPGVLLYQGFDKRNCWSCLVALPGFTCDFSLSLCRELRRPHFHRTGSAFIGYADTYTYSYSYTYTYSITITMRITMRMMMGMRISNRQSLRQISRQGLETTPSLKKIPHKSRKHLQNEPSPAEPPPSAPRPPPALRRPPCHIFEYVTKKPPRLSRNRLCERRISRFFSCTTLLSQFRNCDRNDPGVRFGL